MNPEPQIPRPKPTSESGCGVPPQAVPGASRSETSSGCAEDAELPSSLITAHRSLGTSADDMGFVDPPEMLAEPEYESDYDFEEDAREHELLMDDLADDNDDFARSDEEGWYYSDED